jgi:hypothetical protein
MGAAPARWRLVASRDQPPWRSWGSFLPESKSGLMSAPWVCRRPDKQISLLGTGRRFKTLSQLSLNRKQISSLTFFASVVFR